MWEVLSDLRLTHLAIEMCVLKPFSIMNSIGNQMYYFYVLGKFSSLCALEYEQDKGCRSCGCLEEYEPFLLPGFPLLKYCYLTEEDSNVLNNALNRCEGLMLLNCNVYALSLPSTCICSLQQLCIESQGTEITDSFIDAISAPGTLVHVVLDIFDINPTGITHLIANSRNLISLCVYVFLLLQYEDKTFVDVKKFKAGLKEQFSGRKLFTSGRFKLQQEFQSPLPLDELLQDTDLLPLWP